MRARTNVFKNVQLGLSSRKNTGDEWRHIQGPRIYAFPISGFYPFAICRRNFSTNNMPILVLDWDETLTVRDTTGEIAHAAEKCASRKYSFAYFTEKYLASYAAFLDQFQREHGKIDSVEKEIEYQKQLRKVELESIIRLEKYDFFKGIPFITFTDLASHIELKPGSVEFLKSWKLPVYVLSINWCKSMIETCLKQHGLSDIVVLANDLEHREGVTTGSFRNDVDIRTGYDKSIILRDLKAIYNGSQVIYVGDSHGDVLPIVDADVGILIENGKGKQILELILDLQQIEMLLGTAFESDLDRHQPGKKRLYEGSWPRIAHALGKYLDINTA